MLAKYTIQKIIVPYVDGGIVDISIPTGWRAVDTDMINYGNGFVAIIVTFERNHQ